VRSIVVKFMVCGSSAAVAATVGASGVAGAVVPNLRSGGVDRCAAALPPPGLDAFPRCDRSDDEPAIGSAQHQPKVALGPQADEQHDEQGDAEQGLGGVGNHGVGAERFPGAALLRPGLDRLMITEVIARTATR
jgi:hypothetical protein